MISLKDYFSANFMYFKTFFLPRKYKIDTDTPKVCEVAIIIPSHTPSLETLKLMENITTWHLNFKIYLVDDCTPLEEDPKSAEIFTKASRLPGVTLLRTPSNKLKAGAINFALEHIKTHDLEYDIIFTSDDDITIAPTTLPAMVKALSQVRALGAVCSQSRVLNKNENFLTRLQGLEYLGFNTARLSDEGFFQGPLVMHGMLTGFRAKALLSLGGFDENCLIEDYEITVRLKKQGWHVAMITDAPAWTNVPNNLKSLWKQRVRWIYGGLTVVTKAKCVSPIIQDLIGHSIFLATVALIFASFFLPDGSAGSASQNITHNLSRLIIFISLSQLGLWYLFQLWIMRLYEEKDWKDWVLKILLIPEFIYANIMSLVLIGSYLFFLFNALAKKIPETNLRALRFVKTLDSLFARLGFTQGWGTRNIQS